MIRPLEALEETINLSFFYRGKRGYEIPGRMVERMGSEVREALSKLTSDDTLKVRVDFLWDENYGRRQELSKLLMKFDRKMSRPS